MSGFGAAILILLCIYTFYMGLNDGSNAVATAMVTHAFKPRRAILLASAAKFAVPLALYALGYQAIAGTVSTGLISVSAFTAITPLKGFIFILSGIIAALIWGFATYFLKLPNSTSHTLMGGIIGSGMAAFGVNAVQWSNVAVKIILMVMLAPVIGLLLGYSLMKFIKKIGQRLNLRRTEKVVRALQRINTVVLAGAFSTNNTQKCLGVFILASLTGTVAAPDQSTTFILIFIFAAALTAGLLLGGFRIVNTLGHKIFSMRPIHSLTAQITTTAVMITTSSLGVPVSTGQIMASSIMGVGLAERRSGVRWTVAGRIILSWFATLPFSAGLGACFYLLIAKAFLSL
ncbi:MAG: inorganic phosphate transporter [Clostridiaceae bacterium]|nr:inorganic phosphate transporter [Clostridiaceae bacterium]